MEGKLLRRLSASLFLTVSITAISCGSALASPTDLARKFLTEANYDFDGAVKLAAKKFTAAKANNVYVPLFKQILSEQGVHQQSSSSTSNKPTTSSSEDYDELMQSMTDRLAQLRQDEEGITGQLNTPQPTGNEVWGNFITENTESFNSAVDNLTKFFTIQKNEFLEAVLTQKEPPQNTFLAAQTDVEKLADEYKAYMLSFGQQCVDKAAEIKKLDAEVEETTHRLQSELDSVQQKIGATENEQVELRQKIELLEKEIAEALRAATVDQIKELKNELGADEELEENGAQGDLETLRDTLSKDLEQRIQTLQEGLLKKVPKSEESVDGSILERIRKPNVSDSVDDLIDLHQSLQVVAYVFQHEEILTSASIFNQFQMLLAALFEGTNITDIKTRSSVEKLIFKERDDNVQKYLTELVGKGNATKILENSNAIDEFFEKINTRTDDDDSAFHDAVEIIDAAEHSIKTAASTSKNHENEPVEITVSSISNISNQSEESDTRTNWENDC